MNEITEEQYQLIERFFSNELRREEQSEFDAMMQQPAFRATVKLQHNLKKGLEKEEAIDPLLLLFEEEAKKYKSPVENKSPATPNITRQESSIFTWLRDLLQPRPVYAYALLLLLITTGSVWWANKTYSNQAIVETVYKPLLEDGLAGSVVLHNDTPSQDYRQAEADFNSAKSAFFSADYQKAEQQLSSIKEFSPFFYDAQYFLAYTYFQTKRFDKSIAQFDLLLGDYYENLADGFDNKRQLRWTRLLAYVGSEKTDNAFFKSELDFFLKHKSDYYRKEAQNLETKLNSPLRALIF